MTDVIVNQRSVTDRSLQPAGSIAVVENEAGTFVLLLDGADGRIRRYALRGATAPEVAGALNQRRWFAEDAESVWSKLSGFGIDVAVWDIGALDAILDAGMPELVSGWRALRRLCDRHGVAWIEDSSSETEVEDRLTAVESVGTLLWALAVHTGRSRVLERVMGILPFHRSMEANMLPFDWESAKAAMANSEASQLRRSLADQTVGVLNGLTGDVEPRWRLNSVEHQKWALNVFSPDEVRAYKEAYARDDSDTLTKRDSLTLEVLERIGGELATTLAKYSRATRLDGVWGSNRAAHIVERDGRTFLKSTCPIVNSVTLRSYMTGGAQQIPEELLGFVRADEGEVLVCADLQRAEFVVAAARAGATTLLGELAAGRDPYIEAAARCFKGDFYGLPDKERAKLRTLAKEVVLALGYGRSNSSLADRLGISEAEAAGVTEDIKRAFPELAEGWTRLDSQVESRATNPPAFDWELTFDVYRLHRGLPVKNVARMDEVLGWQRRLLVPLVMKAGPTPGPADWTTRANSGHLRHFPVALDRHGSEKDYWGLFSSLAVELCLTTKAEGRQFVEGFAEAHGLGQLPAARTSGWKERRRAEQQVLELFAGQQILKADLCLAAIERFGVHALSGPLGKAFASQVRLRKAQNRNFAMQAEVAALMDFVKGAISQQLVGLARPVLDKFDEVVVTCASKDADAVMAGIDQIVKDAFAALLPGVPAMVEISSRTSLSKDDVVTIWG